MNGLRQNGVIIVLKFLLISIIKIFSNATLFAVNIEINILIINQTSKFEFGLELNPLWF